MKKCNKCGVEKEEIDFCFKNKSNGIRHTVCSECQRAYKIKHYHNNKPQYYSRNKKTQNLLKVHYNTLKDNSECLVCGEAEPACLDFHHIDPSTKHTEVAKLTLYGSLKRLKNEISKCVVLCSNCHRKLHAGKLTLTIHPAGESEWENVSLSP